MAENAPSTYGTDVACLFDADELWSETDGVALVKQDAIHRLLTDSVLGPGGDGWGYDVRRLMGLPQNRLTLMQPTLAAVLQRDERVLAASVQLTGTITNGLMDIIVSVKCQTAEGSFEFTFSVNDLTSGQLEAQQL